MEDEVDLIRQIRQVDALYRRVFHSIVDPEGTRPIPPRGNGHGKILHALEQCDGLTQKELAARLEIRPQSLTEALTRLEEHGFITRTRSERDKREQLVCITERGREHSHHLQQLRRQTAGQLFSCLDEAEKRQLGELLGRVIDTFRETEGENNV